MRLRGDILDKAIKDGLSEEVIFVQILKKARDGANANVQRNNILSRSNNKALKFGWEQAWSAQEAQDGGQEGRQAERQEGACGPGMQWEATKRV